MRVSLICLMSSLLFISNALAIKVCGDIKQGEIIVVHDGNKTFLKALRRDEPSPFKIGKLSFGVEKTVWDTQSIKGVEQKKVMPSKEDEAEILREQKGVQEALKKNTNKKSDWKKGFIMPLDGQISGQFGNQRIFNGVKKNPHTGTDIAAPLNTPVKAPADGVVVLAAKDYFFSGNMVILDHGDGLKTIYAHLNDISVQEGDSVFKGDVLGLVGQTGRATGPHLHWGAVLWGARFRPQSLLDINQKECRSY